MQVVGISVIALIAFGAGLGISWIISARNARSGLRKARERASRILILAEEEADTLRESTVREVNKKLNRRQAALNTQHAILKKIAQELISDRKELTELDAQLREHEKHLENKSSELKVRHAALEQSSQELIEERTALGLQQSKLEKLEEESEIKNTELDARLNALDKAVQEFDNKRTKLDEQNSALLNIRQELDRERANLDAQRSALGDTRIELDNRRAQIDTQRSTLEEVRKEHDQERAELEAQRSILENERGKLDLRRQRLEQKVARLNEKHDKRRSQLRKGEDQLIEKQQELRISNSESEELRNQAERLIERANARVQKADQRTADLDAKERRLNSLINDRIEKLEIIAGLNRDQARQHLREEIVERAREEAALELLEIRDEKQRTAKHEAQNIVRTTMQRLVRDEVKSNAVSVVPVPSESDKGRIIGRKGQNRRAFETAAQVDLLIDEKPGAVVISSFDPYRREIARIALLRLLRDGHFDPERIERTVNQANQAIEEDIQDAGKRVLLELELRGMDDTLVQIIGKMKYRTSYGQNLLQHSVEVARLCSLMAAEMELDTHVARRAGLLHDIGKVIPESEDRSHELVSMEYCKRYGEHETVCNAVGAHHDKLPKSTMYAYIVQICDAISAARPGARKMDDEKYFERLRNMEEIAKSFGGVSRAFAIKGGRELHVIVEPREVPEYKLSHLTRKISSKIEMELQYPGQITVRVTRDVQEKSVAR